MLVKKRSLALILCMCCLSCSRDITGPDLPDDSHLTAFCILNPDTPAQSLILGRTLTFEQARSGEIPHLDPADYTIDIFSESNRFKPHVMPFGKTSFEKPDLKLPSDIFGTNCHFNVLLEGDRIKPGETYHMTIHSPDNETISANTTIPGPFTIEYSKNDYPHGGLSISWTLSEGAAGYLVDLILFTYDMGEATSKQLIGTKDDTLIYIKTWTALDSSQISKTPYRVQSLNTSISPKQFHRGFLTQKNRFDLTYKDILSLVGLDENNFPNVDYLTKETDWIRIKPVIHALSPSAYHFAAFQYTSLDNQNIVGQKSSLADYSNIQAGSGVLGAIRTKSLPQKHVYPRILFIAMYNLNFPPRLIYPEHDFILSNLDKNLTLEWEEYDLKYPWTIRDSINIQEKYVIVLKPHVLHFSPPAIALIVDSNFYELNLEKSLPFRDCRIEWYIMAVGNHSFSYHFKPYNFSELFIEKMTVPTLVGVPIDKSQLVFSSFIQTRDHYELDNEPVKTEYSVGDPHHSPWSETRTFYLPSGDWPGFESDRPQQLQVTQRSQQPKFRWQPVDGADAYLVVLAGDKGSLASAMVTQARAAMPFVSDPKQFENLQDLDYLLPGETVRWYVQALRVRSGALGCFVEAFDGSKLPELYPRYQHPSGIMLKSLWAEGESFTVE